MSQESAQKINQRSANGDPTAEAVHTGTLSHRLVTEITIDAPIDAVWSTLTHLDAYHEWNPFVIEASGVAEEGAKLAVTIRPVGSKASAFKPTVTEVLPGQAFEWLGRVGIPYLFDGRHRFELERTDDGTATRLRQSEDFVGVMVPFLIKTLNGPTIQGFTAMNEALKARVESDTAAR